ncbi:MAG: heavy metal translocating P-type ATPase metal-binding domain-containing protein, partial [Ferruginibacter sp.]
MSEIVSQKTTIACSHCGDECSPDITINGNNFCCNGCMSVYSLLNSHQLNDYYCLNKMPGIAVKETSALKFRFLDDESIAAQLISFK